VPELPTGATSIATRSTDVTAHVVWFVEQGSALADGTWDATVDTCAYVPRQVHTLADALGGRGGHHLLVSSVSAYAPADAVTGTGQTP